MSSYIIKDKSQDNIAKENNTTKTTVRKHLEKNNIITKRIGKPKNKYKGEKASNYKDGRTLKKYYCKCGKEIRYKSKHCRHCASTITWKKYGQDGVRGNKIVKHHIDLNTKNNSKNNILKLTASKHNSMHKKAYHYLVKIGKIVEYIQWFKKLYLTGGK